MCHESGQHSCKDLLPLELYDLFIIRKMPVWVINMMLEFNLIFNILTCNIDYKGKSTQCPPHYTWLNASHCSCQLISFENRHA